METHGNPRIQVSSPTITNFHDFIICGLPPPNLHFFLLRETQTWIFWEAGSLAQQKNGKMQEEEGEAEGSSQLM